MTLPPDQREAERRAQRQTVRRARARLPFAVRRAAALEAARRLSHTGLLRPGLRLGAYLPAPGEFDPSPLLRRAQQRGAQIFVPRLSRVRPSGMGFAPLSPPLRRNRFGLLEPAATPTASALTLDLILVPLVAFDHKGHRLGMGGGFYDRALSFRHRRRRWFGPRLIGLAFAMQELRAIEAVPWDVRLDAVLTEDGLLTFPEDPT
jgi:5-formyltetrahydrofolate cyclo-ligase